MMSLDLDQTHPYNLCESGRGVSFPTRAYADLPTHLPCGHAELPNANKKSGGSKNAVASVTIHGGI